MRYLYFCFLDWSVMSFSILDNSYTLAFVYPLQVSRDLILNFLDEELSFCKVTFLFYFPRKKSGKIKSSYKRECVNLGCDVDFDFAGPAIHGSAVFGYEGWLAGYQMTFDSAKSKLTRNNFSVGYKTGDFQLHTNV